MSNSLKQQRRSNFTYIHVVVALVLCLLFMCGVSYSVEAVAGRSNDGEVAEQKVVNHECTTVIEGLCVDDQDCITNCKSKKYSGGICEPNDIDEQPFGICCCLN
ncbi:hypothetical protein MKW92_021347 [Papaver armeniacum]|nr:hypothetical protein MKW92_021347 [Papaver armeniacum]